MKQFVEKFLMDTVVRLSHNKYISAIKEGVISVIGITIVGSFFLLIAYPPVPNSWFETVGLFKWIAANRDIILMPFQATMSIISIFVIIGTAYHLSRNLELPTIPIILISLIAFFMTLDWTKAFESVSFSTVVVTNENQSALMELLKLDSLPNIGDTLSITSNPLSSLGMIIPMDNMGSKGMFVGFLCVIVVCLVFNFFKKKNLTIKMPDGVPEGVIRSFEALIPLLVIVSLFELLHLIPALFPNQFPSGIIDLHVILQKLFFWLPIIINSLPGALIMVFFICLLWSLGIHGSSIVEAFTMPILLQLFEANAQAYISGEAIPYILTNQFYYAFVWIGGGGGTLGLVILMAFVARSKYMKVLGKSSLAPCLFNINEPIVFGTPIVLNPYLIVPYIAGPMVCVITSYIATKLGLVAQTVAVVPWTFPAPLYAYFATGGDWKSIILVLINLAILTAIYFPFLIAYDKKLLLEETEENGENSETK